MDWNRVEGNWKDMKGKIKEKWGKLTDDDLTVAPGFPRGFLFAIAPSRLGLVDVVASLKPALMQRGRC